MLPQPAQHLRALFDSLDGLIELWAKLSERPASSLVEELEQHVAARVFFLLLGDVREAPNYDVIRRRLVGRLGLEEGAAEGLAQAMAQALVFVEQGVTRESLADLPYPVRQRLRAKYGNRCAICGWDFSGNVPNDRTEKQAEAQLDHKVPIKLGGDQDANLWILCGLCNGVKAAWLQVAENGRVWNNNHVYHHRLASVAFWVLHRDGACTESGCSVRPVDGRLFVVRRGNAGPWVLDNCRSVCQSHRAGYDAIEY